MLGRSIAIQGPRRWPLSRLSSFVRKATRWLGGGVICFAVGAYVLGAAFMLSAAAYFMWGPFWCITLVQQRIPGLSGFDFEISKRINCDEAINVLVSRVGESKKALIFQVFPPGDNEIPTIRSIGDGTVQISIPSVPFIYCQRDRWETLVVKYDIGVVENHLGRPDEC
jgi:hypothetical protein